MVGCCICGGAEVGIVIIMILATKLICGRVKIGERSMYLAVNTLVGVGVILDLGFCRNIKIALIFFSLVIFFLFVGYCSVAGMDGNIRLRIYFAIQRVGLLFHLVF